MRRCDHIVSHTHSLCCSCSPAHAICTVEPLRDGTGTQRAGSVTAAHRRPHRNPHRLHTSQQCGRPYHSPTPAHGSRHWPVRHSIWCLPRRLSPQPRRRLPRQQARAMCVSMARLASPRRIRPRRCRRRRLPSAGHSRAACFRRWLVTGWSCRPQLEHARASRARPPWARPRRAPRVPAR